MNSVVSKTAPRLCLQAGASEQLWAISLGTTRTSSENSGNSVDCLSIFYKRTYLFKNPAGEVGSWVQAANSSLKCRRSLWGRLSKLLGSDDALQAETGVECAVTTDIACTLEHGQRRLSRRAAGRPARPSASRQRGEHKSDVTMRDTFDVAVMKARMPGPPQDHRHF
jgi:hypothetical protein